DLIVADKGSNEVSVLINIAVGDSFSFVPGPRLHVGAGPVSTAVADVNGDGVPDLLVADSGANEVRLLRGIGNGFFDDQTPTIYPVGTNPSAMFVGQCLAGQGPELVTLDSGSNSVTMISGLGTAAPVTQTIPSGGVDPIAAFAVDLQGKGLDSLVVANNGDGMISLLTAGESGLTLSSVQSAPGLPNPSALALASFSGGDLEFYATTEGEASASLLGFDLAQAPGGLPGGGIPISSPTSSSPSELSGVSAQLVSLNETSLALIGTLLTITINGHDETESAAGGLAAGVGSAASG